MLRPIKVRDFRNKQFFMVDDAYLNGYARHLGVTASMIYICLCRHVDKEQVAFPSQRTIAEKLGIKWRTVMEKTKLLEKWGLIDVKKIRNENGVWLNNTYTLLDKTEWKKIPRTEKVYMDEPYTVKLQSPPTVLQQHKDTHIKYTHIHSIADEDFNKIADTYKVPVSFVKSKYDDLVNYCERSGKHYKNYLAALRNFVKQDAMKIRKEDNGRSKITVITPDPNWNS